mgnify:FL=1
MAQKREFPTDPEEWSHTPAGSYGLGAHRPLTEIEALLQLAPHQDSQILALETTAALREAIADAIDTLPEADEWIFNALCVAGLSLRFTGRVLGIPKTTLARRRDAIRRRLMAELTQHQFVRDWLTDGLRL